jgi:O-succinylbenzoic acid--CoA ligase
VTERYDLLWRARLTPDAPAIESAAGVLSFAGLADQAQRTAAFLHSIAPSGDAPIALLMDGHAGFAAWFHGLALAGRTALPLNSRLTAGEIAQQLENARAVCVLGEAGDSRLEELRARLPRVMVAAAPRLESLAATFDPRLATPGDGNAVLAVLFTSGTTGRSKGACLTWNNFLASARAAHDRLGVAVCGRWLACMPLFHVGGLSILMRSMLFGGAVRLQSRFDASAVSDALDGGDIAGVSLVPTMLSRLLAHRGGRAAPAGLQALLLGGAAAAPELTARALAAGYPVCPTYGLTEATSQVATAAPPPPGATTTSPMLAVAGTELRVVADSRDVPAGTAGEILVRGPTVMPCYLHDRESTARALRDGWLHTGDIGFLDPGGGLHVLDRRDDLVVSGGENVYPAQVEAVLLEHPDVEDAGVTGVADADLGARVVAWLVPKAGSTVGIESLQRHCRERLAGFKRPREFRFVATLPRNAAGKLQRRHLVEIDAGN